MRVPSDCMHRQTNWNQKRDLYADLIKTAQELGNLYKNISDIPKLVKYPFPEMDAHITAEFTKTGQQLQTAEAALRHAFALAKLFANDECAAAIGKYFKSHNEAGEPLSSEWAAARCDAALTLTVELVSAAKKDLSLVI